MTQLVFYHEFGDLLSESEGEPTTDVAAFDLFFEYGRSFILAPQGAGKSSMLQRLSRQSEGCETAIHSIPALSAQLALSSRRDRFRHWLTQKSRRPIGMKLLICLDGLDEVPPAEAQAILDAVEAISRKDPQLAVVITDRVTRRATAPGRWAFFGVSSSDTPDQHSWRSLPFYRTEAGTRSSRSSVIRKKIDEASRSDGNRVGTLASAAFEWLREADSTAAPIGELASVLGEMEFESLRASGLLTERDGAELFIHPLYHAYFAAEYLRDRPDQWREDAWETLTVDGASFSALGLLLERVDDQRVDSLVRSIDRWNYMASASLLAEDRAPEQRIPDDIRSALLLLLGFRRFSPTLNTAVVAEDMLRLQQKTSLIEKIIAAASRDELVRIASTLPRFSDWWGAWVDVFTSSDYQALIASLSGDDYLIAWTAANVLSSSELDPSVENALLELALSSDSSDVRWRAVHALGSSRSAAVAQKCLQAFKSDVEEWVRYGALRVFLQVVARLPERERRLELCLVLAESAESIQGNSRWEREIERAADLRDAPPDWPDTFGVVVSTLLAGSQSLAEEDRWRAAVSMLRLDPIDPFGVSLRPVMGDLDG